MFPLLGAEPRPTSLRKPQPCSHLPSGALHCKPNAGVEHGAVFQGSTAHGAEGILQELHILLFA